MAVVVNPYFGIILNLWILLINPLNLLANESSNIHPLPNPSPSPSKSAHEEQKITGGKKQKSEADQKPASNISPIVPLTNTESPQKQRNRNTEQPTNPSSTDWIFWFTAVLALMAIVQGIALWWTYWIMRNTARRQLRAYIFPRNVLLSVTNNVLSIDMRIINSGETPAYKVRSWAEMVIIPQVDENSLVIQPISEEFSGSLGSNQEMIRPIIYQPALTNIQIQRISDGSLSIYIHGRIVYVDAFQKSHFTNFRLRYIGIFPPPPNNMMFFCQQGNEAD